MLAKLVEKRKELEAKKEKLHKIFEEAGDELDMEKVTSLEGDSKAKAEKIRQMNDELTDLGAEVDDLVTLEKAAKADEQRQQEEEEPEAIGLHPQQGAMKVKSLGEMFIESDAFKGFKRGDTKGPVATLDVDMKTLFQTSAGWAPEAIRTGLVVPYATRPIRIIDIIPPGTTDQVSIVYMEHTTFTNAAAEVAEGGVKPEATLELTERSSSVRKIAVWIPVTDEQLEDVAGIQSFLTTQLTIMLRQRLDSQLLVGDGIAPNLAGLLNVANVQTFVLAGDRFDAIYEAIKRVRVIGRADPNVIVMHPNDWQQLRLMRTDGGLYILGNPSEPGPVRIWGLPVVESTAEKENSVLTGDFANFCQLFEKKGVDIQISDSHDSYFIYNKKAVRADIRMAFPVYRPPAFCVITDF